MYIKYIFENCYSESFQFLLHSTFHENCVNDDTIFIYKKSILNSKFHFYSHILYCNTIKRHFFMNIHDFYCAINQNKIKIGR